MTAPKTQNMPPIIPATENPKPLKPLSGQHHPKSHISRPAPNTKALIVIQGAPGLGKTFIGPSVITALRARGCRAVALEQDEFAVHGLSRSGALCRERFSALISGSAPGQHGDVDAVVLLRNNANLGQFRAYADMAHKAGWAVHALAPRGFGGDLRALALCLAAVYRRGAQHPTFGELSAAKRAAITVAFFVEFRRAKRDSTVEFVSDVDWVRPAGGRKTRERSGGFEAEIEAELERLVTLAKEKKSPFDLAEGEVDMERLVRVLRLEGGAAGGRASPGGLVGCEAWREDVGKTVDQIVRAVAGGGLKAFQWVFVSFLIKVKILGFWLFSYDLFLGFSNDFI